MRVWNVKGTRAVVAAVSVIATALAVFIVPPTGELANATPAQAIGTQTDSSAPKLAHRQDTTLWQDPQWIKLPDLRAHWLHKLTQEKIYWTTWGIPDHGAGDTVGSISTVLNESYDWKDKNTDGGDYKTRPTMEFERIAPYNSANGLLGRDQFSSHATGVFENAQKGIVAERDPITGEKVLSVYFWNDNSGIRENYHKSLPRGYIPVLRVTSALQSAEELPTNPKDPATYTDIYVGLMPTPGNAIDINGWTHGPGGADGAGLNLWSTGGEVSQATGYLYTSSIPGAEIDGNNVYTTEATTSRSQYCIWDPTTGDYSLSHLVQPGDWYKGMTSPPMDRWMLRRQIGDTSTGPKYTNGSNQNVAQSSTTASADMGMDALGNMYLYYGGDAVPGSGLNYNAGIAKIIPTRDETGTTIPDGTEDNPWRYNNVTKIRSQLGESWSGAGAMWGVGIRSGKFYVGTTISTSPGPGEVIPGTSSRQSRIVRVDPLTGLGKILGSATNALGDNFVPPSNHATYVPATGPESFDMASASELMVIQGTLYNDVDGKGQTKNGNGSVNIERPVNATYLSGQTLAIYDQDKKRIGTTKTSAKGEFSFIVAESGRYYIRVVQPQVLQSNGSAVAAHQTWGGATSGTVGTGVGTKTNVAKIRCLATPEQPDISDPTGRAVGVCSGTKVAPYIEKNMENLNATGTESDWNFYSIVDIQSSAMIPVVDFGFTTRGSYGDASKPPFNSTIDQKGPVLQSADQNDLKLGKTLGFDTDGVNDAKAAAHSTDDGIFIKVGTGANATTVPLQGAALARGKTYTIRAEVGGKLADASKVSAWYRNADAAGTESVVVTPKSVTADPKKQPTDPTTYSAEMDVTIPAAAGALTLKQLRAIVAPDGVNAAEDDTSGVFAQHKADDPANNSRPWTVPGEVEDYAFYAGNTIVRLQAQVDSEEPDTVTKPTFKYKLTNVEKGVAPNPSSDEDSIVITDWKKPIGSSTVHSVADYSASNPGVSISDVTDASTLNKYHRTNMVCTNTVEGSNVPVTDDIEKGTIKIDGSKITSGSDITCRVDYDSQPRFILPKAGDGSKIMLLGIAILLLSVAGMLAYGLVPRKRS